MHLYISNGLKAESLNTSLVVKQTNQCELCMLHISRNETLNMSLVATTNERFLYTYFEDRISDVER